MQKENSNRLELSSPLTPDECVLRLREAIDIEGLATVLFGSGSKPVIGKVSESYCRLHRRIAYRNSFQTYLSATLRPMPGGTAISASFAMHPLVRIFNIISFGFLTLITFILLLATASNGLSGVGHGTLIDLSALAMVGFQFAILRFGRYLARNDSRVLADFLIEALDAHREEPLAPLTRR
jgi:hypothetical protein